MIGDPNGERVRRRETLVQDDIVGHHVAAQSIRHFHDNRRVLRDQLNRLLLRRARSRVISAEAALSTGT